MAVSERLWWIGHSVLLKAARKGAGRQRCLGATGAAPGTCRSLATSLLPASTLDANTTEAAPNRGGCLPCIHISSCSRTVPFLLLQAMQTLAAMGSLELDLRSGAVSANGPNMLQLGSFTDRDGEHTR